MTALSMDEEGESPSGKLRHATALFLPMVLFGGIALAALIFLLIMKGVGWKIGPDRLFATAGLPSSDIYLLDSANTRRYFASVGGNYDLMLNQWRYFFSAKGIGYRDIHDEDLPGLSPGILILPSSVALSLDERNAVRQFEQGGGSVLATWATGARAGNGEWQGWDFLKDQFGVTVSGEIAKVDNENFLAPFGDTAVSHTLPSGDRIWLGQLDERPLRITGGGHVAGRFMDAVRTPDSSGANEAVVYNEYGSSRRVYFGFPETSWRFQQPDIYALLLDVLDWLHRKPSAYLAYWPYPARAAQILEMDTEQGFPDAVNFARELDDSGFHGTFYCLTSVATQYPDVVKGLARRHELAYHGDVHDGFKGQAASLQSQRMDNMVRQMRTIMPDTSDINGFRPPLELYDNTTESVLHEKGFRHLLADSNNTSGRLPYLSKAGSTDIADGLVIFPRTQRDDINLLRQGLEGDSMTRAMNLDFDLAVEMAALGVFSVHSQNFAAGSPVAKSMSQYLAHIRTAGEKVWVRPSGEIAKWWRDRSRVSFTLSGDAKRMLLNVTFARPAIPGKVSIVVTNAASGVVPQIQPVKVGVPVPEVKPLDEFRSALVFPSYAPGDYSYYLSF